MSDNVTVANDSKNKGNAMCLDCSLDTLIVDEKIQENFYMYIKSFLKHTVLKLSRKLSEVNVTFVFVL